MLSIDRFNSLKSFNRYIEECNATHAGITQGSLNIDLDKIKLVVRQ